MQLVDGDSQGRLVAKTSLPMESSKTLIVGSGGFVGRLLSNYLAGLGVEIVRTTCVRENVTELRMFLDLAEDASGWRLPEGVSIAYLFGAITSLGACRKAPEASARINVRGTADLAERLAADGALVVFPSTNLVFDGTKPFMNTGDAVSPRCEYGRQKAEAEKRLRTLGDSACVVRFTKIVGALTPLFCRWMEAIEKRETIRPCSDMVLSPVPVSFVVRVLHRIAERRLSGVIHVSGEKDITYEQAARFLARGLSASEDLIRPVKAEEARIDSEVNPAHTTLDVSELKERAGLTPPDVWTAMEAVVEEYGYLGSTREHGAAGGMGRMDSRFCGRRVLA